MDDYVLMDAKNYSDDMEEIHREAVRGIIFVDGKMLLVATDKEEVKLPGGGIEAGENDVQALIREVREETGRTVIPESIKYFKTIDEKRASIKEYAIYHQISRLYFCDVDDTLCDTHFSPGEIRHHLHSVRMTLDEAIEADRLMLEREGYQAWNQREYRTFLIIKDYLENNE